MDALIEAAQAEGTLNVIALPPSWANYEEMLEHLQREVRHRDRQRQPRRVQPGRDQRGDQPEGQDRARRPRPRHQLRQAGRGAGPARPLPGGHWDEIPENQKDPTGAGTTTTAASSRSAATPRSSPSARPACADLLDPQYAGQVALNGNPTQAAAAFSGVWAAALANGGSLDDIGPGIDFFVQVKDAGNFNPVEITPATVQSGETPISIDWDYVNAGQTQALADEGSSGRSTCPPTGSSAATTARRSASSPRTRRPPGSGRSSSTATRARTSGSRAAPGRSGCPPWRRPAPPTRRRWPRCRRSTARGVPDDEQQTAAQEVIAERWNAEMSG